MHCKKDGIVQLWMALLLSLSTLFQNLAQNLQQHSQSLGKQTGLKESGVLENQFSCSKNNWNVQILHEMLLKVIISVFGWYINS